MADEWAGAAPRNMLLGISAYFSLLGAGVALVAWAAAAAVNRGVRACHRCFGPGKDGRVVGAMRLLTRANAFGKGVFDLAMFVASASKPHLLALIFSSLSSHSSSHAQTPAALAFRVLLLAMALPRLLWACQPASRWGFLAVAATYVAETLLFTQEALIEAAAEHTGAPEPDVNEARWPVVLALLGLLVALLLLFDPQAMGGGGLARTCQMTRLCD